MASSSLNLLMVAWVSLLFTCWPSPFELFPLILSPPIARSPPLIIDPLGGPPLVLLEWPEGGGTSSDDMRRLTSDAGGVPSTINNKYNNTNITRSNVKLYLWVSRLLGWRPAILRKPISFTVKVIINHLDFYFFLFLFCVMLEDTSLGSFFCPLEGGGCSPFSVFVGTRPGPTGGLNFLILLLLGGARCSRCWGGWYWWYWCCWGGGECKISWGPRGWVLRKVCWLSLATRPRVCSVVFCRFLSPSSFSSIWILWVNAKEKVINTKHKIVKIKN